MTTSNTAKFDFQFTNDVQTVTLSPGRYLLECWGSQGAGFNVLSTATDAGIGGKGGYSKGILNLYEDTDIFVFVGGTGTTTITPGTIGKGGFNGGGSAWCTQYSSEPGSGGGGASDIRLNTESLHSRVIVAGGGGGGGEDKDDYGGFGGGIEGGFNYGKNWSPGNQFNSGNKGSGGRFGYGAHTDWNGGGAGGGWYGANAMNGSDTDYTSGRAEDTNGGSGGSGYVYTESTSSYYPDCLLSPDYYLEEAETIPGNTTITEPDGSTSVGHSGNGFVRITILSFIPVSYTFKNGTTTYLTFDNETCGVKANNNRYSCLKDISIPESIRNFTVVSILGRSFAGDHCLESVFIPKSVISIHHSAFFYCDHLRNVTFETGSKLTHIMNESFAITNITSIEIPHTITFIGHHAFYNCPLLSSFSACTFNTIDTSNVFELSNKLRNIIVSVYYPIDSFSDLPVVRSQQFCKQLSSSLKCPNSNNLIIPYHFQLKKLLSIWPVLTTGKR